MFLVRARYAFQQRSECTVVLHAPRHGPRSECTRYRDPASYSADRLPTTRTLCPKLAVSYSSAFRCAPPVGACEPIVARPAASNRRPARSRRAAPTLPADSERRSGSLAPAAGATCGTKEAVDAACCGVTDGGTTGEGASPAQISGPLPARLLEAGARRRCRACVSAAEASGAAPLPATAMAISAASGPNTGSNSSDRVRACSGDGAGGGTTPFVTRTPATRGAAASGAATVAPPAAAAATVEAAAGALAGVLAGAAAGTAAGAAPANALWSLPRPPSARSSMAAMNGRSCSRASLCRAAAAIAVQRRQL